MNRRDFLTMAGAVASIEFAQPAAGEPGESTAGTADDVTSFARGFPDAAALATGGGYAFSVTQLDDDVAKLVDGPITDAAVYGTLFAGRVTTDIAFGIDDRTAVLDHLAADNYVRRDRRDGWLVMSKRLRNRHQVVAVSGSTAVLGTGPILRAVRNDVRKTTLAVDRADAGKEFEKDDKQIILDHLGSGVHHFVDMKPNPHRAPTSVEATGVRYQFDGDTTVVRSVTLFDTPIHARAASRDDLEATTIRQFPAAGDCSTDCQGRAVVRDTRLPPAAVPSGSYRPTE